MIGSWLGEFQGLSAPQPEWENGHTLAAEKNDLGVRLMVQERLGKVVGKVIKSEITFLLVGNAWNCHVVVFGVQMCPLCGSYRWKMGGCTIIGVPPLPIKTCVDPCVLVP